MIKTLFWVGFGVALFLGSTIILGAIREERIRKEWERKRNKERRK